MMKVEDLIDERDSLRVRSCEMDEEEDGTWRRSC